MTDVTAKVRLRLAEPDPSGEQVRLEFGADYDDDRNREWAKYTPALSISMTVKAEVAERNFPQGRAFTLTFTPEDD